MKALVFAVLVAAGCTNNDPAMTQECPVIGKTVVEMCGPAPAAPGYVVAANGDTVTMATTDYNAINQWRAAVGVWRDCVTNIP